MVALSANAGISITLGGVRIFVDALHTEKAKGFSAVSTGQWEVMQSDPHFQAPDVICCTHCHPDHYSRALVAQAHRLWPEAALILPEEEFQNQHLITGRETAFSYQRIHFRFFKLPHEGNVYAKTPHYGLLLSDGAFQVLLTGDCAVASPELETALHGSAPDLALLDFPWITLGRGRAFIQNILKARHLLICHLPFSQDDTCGYRSAAVDALKYLPHSDVRLLWEPLQVEVY